MRGLVWKSHQGQPLVPAGSSIHCSQGASHCRKCNAPNTMSAWHLIFRCETWCGSRIKVNRLRLLGHRYTVRKVHRTSESATHPDSYYERDDVTCESQRYQQLIDTVFRKILGFCQLSNHCKYRQLAKLVSIQVAGLHLNNGNHHHPP